MDYLFQDGGEPKKKSKTKTKSKTGSKIKSSSKTGTKSSTKTSSKTTNSKSSSKKGGNFLGAVGDLVAPTGWGPFATAAGLLALDRADAALRRGKSEKSSVKKGGMRGGNEENIKSLLKNYKAYLSKINYNNISSEILFSSLFDTELALKRNLSQELSKDLNSNEKEKIIADMITKAQKEVNFVPIENYIDEFQKSYKKYKNGNSINKNYEQKFKDILSSKFKLSKKYIDDYVLKYKNAVDNSYT